MSSLYFLLSLYGLLQTNKKLSARFCVFLRFGRSTSVEDLDYNHPKVEFLDISYVDNYLREHRAEINLSACVTFSYTVISEKNSYSKLEN